MKSRSDFLKTAATGAVVLGAQSKLGLAAMLDQHAEAGKSKVVVARDAALHGSRRRSWTKSACRRCSTAPSLLTPAATSRSRHGSASCPVGKVIGLKVNGLGGKGISTHAALVLAICERLQQAGVKPGKIFVWDRNARDLRGLRPDHQHRSQPHSLLRLRRGRLRRAAGTWGSAQYQARQDPYPRVRHGDQSADPQGPQHGRRHLCDEEHVRRGRAAQWTCMPAAAIPAWPI